MIGTIPWWVWPSAFIAIMAAKLSLMKWRGVAGDEFDRYLSIFCCGLGIGMIIMIYLEKR